MKKVFCLVLALILTLSPIGAFAQDDSFFSETFKESGVIIYEAKSGETLYNVGVKSPCFQWK